MTLKKILATIVVVLAGLLVPAAAQATDGVWESCPISTSMSTCNARVNYLGADGALVRVINTQATPSNSDADITSYASNASAHGEKIIWWVPRGTTDAVVDHFVDVTKSLTATWGYDIGDEFDGISSSAWTHGLEIWEQFPDPPYTTGTSPDARTYSDWISGTHGHTLAQAISAANSYGGLTHGTGTIYPIGVNYWQMSDVTTACTRVKDNDGVGDVPGTNLQLFDWKTDSPSDFPGGTGGNPSVGEFRTMRSNSNNAGCTFKDWWYLSAPSVWPVGNANPKQPLLDLLNAIHNP